MYIKLIKKYSLLSIIMLIGIYICHEPFILRWFPLSEAAYAIIWASSEFLIYSLLLLAVFSGNSAGFSNRQKLILILVVSFVLWALFTSLLNGAPFVECLRRIRVLIRYLALFWLAAYVSRNGITQEEYQKIFSYFLIIGTINSLIAIYQHYLGIASFWLPRNSELSIAGASIKHMISGTGWAAGREQGASPAMFGDTIYFATFQFFLCSFIAAHWILKSSYYRSNTKRFLVLAGINILGILYTGSAASVAVTVVGVGMGLLITYKANQVRTFFLIILALIALPILAIFVTGNSTVIRKQSKTYLSDLTNVLSIEYYQNNTSRAWMLVSVGGSLVTSSESIIGYGASQEYASLQIYQNSAPSDKRILRKLPIYGPFEDVYWVALIAYYGFIGVSILALILRQLFIMANYVYKNGLSEEAKLFGLFALMILVSAIFYTFIIRTLVLRVFAFHFWLVMGLVALEYRMLLAKQPQK